VVARLETMTAQVERMPRERAAWQPAKIGDTFVIGSAVRTGADSRAKLRVGRGGKLDVNPSSVIYFSRTPGRARDDVRIETGSIEIESADDAIGFGDAVLEPNGKARLESTPQGTTILVTLGRVVLEDNVIAAGESVTLSSAGAVASSPRDAGVAPRTGLRVAVTGKPARAWTSSGEGELAVGEHAVEPGTAIRAPEGSVVGIARDGARGDTAGPSDVTVSDGASLVAIKTGSVELHADTAEAIAALPGGTVTARVGGAASASVDASGLATIDAQRGEALIETAKGKQALAEGESATVTAAGVIERVAPPPKRTVVTIEAGESPTLHDPQAPTPVRVSFGTACRGAGTVEVAKDRAFKRVIARSGGTEGANVLVPAGSFSYRLRCQTGAGATGTIRVAKDSGRTPLPKAAARTAVELDGREYTILYQNLLPELTLSWRNAPRRPKYTFVVKPKAGAEKRVSSATPKVTFRPGELREGSYRAWAEPEGGARSEEGRIVIEFDNAAPSASIDGVEADGDRLRIKGTVIESSTVSAGGAPVELDRHRRFTTELAATDAEDGVSVRIAHPKLGIHYYVMRTGPR
jgi:hypothetical protein